MSETMVRLVALGAAAFLIFPTAAQARAPSSALDHSRCGTLDVLQGRQELRDVAARAAPAVCQRNRRPVYDEPELYDDDEYKFRIHYTLDTGDNRSVTLDQVLQTAEVMREVMDMEGGMGYPMPPDDEIDADVYCDDGYGGDGGNGYYDIYFVNERGIYGYARPMSIVPGSDQSATSHLALSTWILEDQGWLEVTVAHEFFHAIQFVYDVYEDSFWMENSAVWMEEQTYDDVNDYLNYVPEAMEDPDKPLDSLDSIQYGYGIWPMYMSQEHGQGVVQDIWEACAAKSEGNAFEAQKQVLDGVHTGGWSKAVLDFRGAMYNQAEFDEGDLFNRSVTARESVTSYPAAKTYSVDHTGGDYIVFSGTGSSQTLQLCFAGREDETVAKVYLRDYDDVRTEVTLSPSNHEGRITVEGLGSSVRQVALVVTYASTVNSTDNYAYSAILGDTECEIPDPGAPSDGGDGTPADGDPIDGGDSTTVCGGCIIIEEGDPTSGAVVVLNLMWMLGGIFVVRRRLS